MRKAGNRCESNTHTHTQENFNGIKNKNNKGITLVALVVSIIVLLILSMVSINAIVGENGLIARTEEARVLTLLANFLFDVESGIQDINIDNVLNDKTMNNTEMLEALKKKKVFTTTMEVPNYGYGISKDSIALDNVEIWYNGDIYVDNYKRGKISLPHKSNTLESDNKSSKITVNNGTIENYKKDGDISYYYLHADDSKNFAYWIDKYGEVISIFPDTIISVGSNREEEYTAIYDANTQKWLQRSTIANCSSNSSYFKIGMYGLTSRVLNNEDGTLTASADDKYMLYSVYVNREFKSSKGGIAFHQGYMLAQLNLYFSPDQNALIRYKMGNSEESDVICRVNRTYEDANLKVENNYKTGESFNNGALKLVTVKDKDYICFMNELDTRDFSRLAHSEWNISIQSLKNFFAREGYEDVSRLYYFASAVCYTTVQSEYGGNNSISWKLSGYMQNKFEQTIKFIDI